jgi:hypothetical protein
MPRTIRYPTTERISRRAAIVGAATTALATSVPLHAQRPAASPVATPITRGETYPADARDRLRNLLSSLPDGAMQGELLFDWVDWDAQFAALGIADPHAEEHLLSLTRPVMTFDPLVDYTLKATRGEDPGPDIVELVGFRPLDAHQVLAVGDLPDSLRFYRGGIDIPGLQATWEANGYQRKTNEHGEYWTLGENGEVDMQNPVQRALLYVLNNVAILDETTVVYASTLDSLAPVMALAYGEGQAAVDDADLGHLIDVMPSDAVNAFALPGERFRSDRMPREDPGMNVEAYFADSDAAVGPMPETRMALFGVTAGLVATSSLDAESTPVPPGRPDAHAFLLFLTVSTEDARSAAEVAYWRLANLRSPATGVAYADRFIPTSSIEDAVEGEVMVIRYTDSTAWDAHWRAMVLRDGDLWPFAWIGEPQYDGEATYRSLPGFQHVG